MAVNQYTLNKNVTVAAGTAATVVAGEPGTAGAAGFGSASTVTAGIGYFPQTFLAGTTIMLDPTGPVYTAIGAGNLNAFRDGTDNVGHAGLSN